MSEGPVDEAAGQVGERWPEKRARAVIFAGANKLAKEQAELDPEAVADAGLRVRELLFTDAEVREDNANVKEHQIGYTADCMQFATLQPVEKGLALGLWVGPEAVQEAKKDLDAEPDPNPFRSHFGWVRVNLEAQAATDLLRDWVQRARMFAREQKKAQEQTAL